MSWFKNAVIYHVYPLGYCGAPRDNDYTPAVTGHGPILRLIPHLPIIKSLGFNTIFFGPVFESARHGYDTSNYQKIDSRLGTNDDFITVCAEIHRLGMRVILDAVLNHVGRDFWAFRDVREKKLQSPYRDWFRVREGNSNYNDGFFYEGWEGHYELVKLNLFNNDLKQHLFDSIRKWREWFGIDGLRLDVAYCLEMNFLKELRGVCKYLPDVDKTDDFWLLGEVVHGDYNKWVNPETLDSVTNYVCYKGLYSSFNTLNMFEAAYTLSHQFATETWSTYAGKQLYNFVDNHDVTRAASILTESRHLPGLYALLFTIPGVPSVYYGSEYAVLGDKKDGDDELRKPFSMLMTESPPEITSVIRKLARAHAALEPLYAGSYKQLVLQNRHIVFVRTAGADSVYTLINADAVPATVYIGGFGEYYDILSDKTVDIGQPVSVPAFGAMVLARGYIDFDGEEAPKLAQALPDPIEPEPVPEQAQPDLKEPDVAAEPEQAQPDLKEPEPIPEPEAEPQKPVILPKKRPVISEKPLNIPIKAVLFDLDGVVLDTETEYLRAGMETAETFNLSITKDILKTAIGKDQQTCEKIWADAFGEENLELFNRESFNILYRNRDKSGILTKTGFFELAYFLKANGIKIAVATSTGKPATYAKLAYARLLSKFDAIICRSDYEKGKPEPDAFLAAAEALGVGIADCLIIEDSEPGLIAAKTSGAKFIYAEDIAAVSEEISASAEKRVTDLADVIRYLKSISL